MSVQAKQRLGLCKFFSLMQHLQQEGLKTRVVVDTKKHETDIDRHESRPNAMKRLNRYIILRFLCWGGDIAFFSISPRDGLSQERERRNAWRWRTKRLERMRRYYVLHIGITSVANQNCNLIEQSLNRNPRSSQSHRSSSLPMREMTSRRFRLPRKIPRDNC